MKTRISKLEEEIILEASGTDCVIRYDRSFQYFLDKNKDISKMDFIIYGVSRNGKKCLCYTETGKPDESQKIKLKPLYEHFALAGIELDSSAQT